jgi:hypothetical protein
MAPSAGKITLRDISDGLIIKYLPEECCFPEGRDLFYYPIEAVLIY